MRIAYLILAHNTPNHLSRLIGALESPEATFLIHVDRKSDISPYRKGVLEKAAFLEDRVEVYWGDFTDVQATINLIREALKDCPEAEYLVLLSGSDYPLKSPQYIANFFSSHKGQQFINLVEMPCKTLNKPLERLENYWFLTPHRSQIIIRAIARLNRLNTQLKLVQRDFATVFNGLRPYAGSQWWALTGDACRHILTFIDSKPEVVKFFKNVYMPDESFFQTIIGNSDFKNNVRRNLTFADWSRPSGGPALIDMDHVRHFADCSPLIADDVYGCGELLFARKFSDDSDQIVKSIDAQVINKGGSTVC